jgi:hypothetical protein
MKRSAPPNYWLAVSATVLLISLMAYVRLVVFPHEFVPLAYAVFMLVALWHRDRRLLWTMAGSFLVVVLVKMTMVMPESAVPLPTRLLFSGMQMTNILVPAAIVHAVLNLRERLESTIGVMERTNSELETTNEELAAREEEINQQNEELQSQAVELEQQVEEASAQAEELHALNSQLAARERMLSDLLQPSVTEGTEAEVLERLGQKIVRLLGDRAAGALLSEPRDGVMAVYPLFGVADGPHEMPRRQSLSDLVASRDRAALLADTALRSDLEFPTLASGTPAASVISAPLRTPDGGALEVYAAEPEAWSDEDLRLVQRAGASADASADRDGPCQRGVVPLRRARPVHLHEPLRRAARGYHRVRGARTPAARPASRRRLRGAAHRVGLPPAPVRRPARGCRGPGRRVGHPRDVLGGPRHAGRRGSVGRGRDPGHARTQAGAGRAGAVAATGAGRP